MKIEVGESLMRSWLRHVKGCQLAELNWKPSSDWTQYHDPQPLMDKARAHFLENLGEDVFEGTKTASQLVKQGEIDVLDIKLDRQGVIEKFYGVDIAFHEGGLNYRDVKATTIRVLKKTIRSVLVSQTYFGRVPSEFIFASPRVGNSFLGQLQDGITRLRQFLIEGEMDCEVTLLVNDTFRTEVLAPTLSRSAGTADGSVLFLRSYRLLRLFDSGKRLNHLPSENTSRAGTISDKGNSALPIELEPANIQEFKNRLLSCRKARIIIEYANGTSKENNWIAERFTDHSNPLGNLRSRPEFRQGEWQKRGIARLRVIDDDQQSSLTG